MLPSVVRTQLCSEGSAAGTAGGQQLTPVTRKLFERRPRFDVGQNTCNEVEAPLLLQKCKVLGAWSLDEERNTRREVESISQTLSIGLLEHIRTSFLNAPEDNDPVAGHCRQVNIRSTVQEIVALQTKLYATQDEDEQRALEEDITGKARAFLEL
ncbi:hypothetical protein BKA83DRAFT_2817573 [Pisolithus microcarpus]|nr:hypothetical protein BKA83DRAFT_2817573 [Pisolithus microcarpus]